MRVHLRGVVIGVGVVLSVVVIVAVFNAYDTTTSTKRGRYSTGGDTEEDTPRSRKHAPKARNSRSSPRSSTRLRAGGPGARAGGARAGGGGGGARAGGAGGARAGGGARNKPGGGAKKATEDDAGFDLDAMETPTEDAEEFPVSPPKKRKGGNGGMSAQRTAAAAGPSIGGGVLDDNEEMELPIGKKKKRGKASAKASEEKVEEEKKEKEKEEKEEKTEKEEEDKDGEGKKKGKKHKKKQHQYPEWWKASVMRSGVSQLLNEFVGDQPLFSECPTFQEVGGGPKEKIKRYGHLARPNFLGNSKNPCWFEFNGKKDILKCIPYFYIGGVPKAAVADLFGRMSTHPAIITGEVTEFNWWDRARYGAMPHPKYTKEAKRTADPIQLKDYSKTLVGSHGKNMTKAVMYYGKSESLIGDATPTYLVENTQWDIFEGNEGCSEPRIIPASFMYHVFPDARFFFILRDPIDRLYARFLSYVPYVEEFENHTASLFHTFTVQAVDNYRACFARTSIRQCAYNTSLYTNAVIRLSEGMYSIFLQDWFRIFPREQILIYKHEEYVNDIKGHVLQSFKHLGLDPLSEYSMLKVEEMPVHRKGKSPEQEGFIMPQTVALLKEFYEPFNMLLAELLDDEKWLFPRDDPVPPAPVNVDVEEEGRNDIQPPSQAATEELPGESGAPAAEKPAEEAAGGGGGGVADVVSADGGAAAPAVVGIVDAAEQPAEGGGSSAGVPGGGGGGGESGGASGEAKTWDI